MGFTDHGRVRADDTRHKWLTMVKKLSCLDLTAEVGDDVRVIEVNRDDSMTPYGIELKGDPGIPTWITSHEAKPIGIWLDSVDSPDLKITESNGEWQIQLESGGKVDRFENLGAAF